MEYKLISADDHVGETRTVFDRVPARLRDKVPHIESQDGRDVWMLDGKMIGRLPDEQVLPGAWSDKTHRLQTRGTWDPVARLDDYTRDGVDAAILFPNAPVGFAGDPLWFITDLEARAAAIRSYNDWLVEDFCSADSQRLIPLAALPSWDVDLAVDELKHSLAKGHRGAVFAAIMDPFGNTPTYFPYWDPLWATLQEADFPVCFHQQSGGLDRPSLKKYPDPEGLSAMTTARASWHMGSMAQALPELLLSGMLDRFPNLKIYLAEAGAGWVPFMLTQTEYQWGRSKDLREPKLKLRPSEYWQRNFATGFWSEPLWPDLVEFLGAHTLLWEGDYPHVVATYPDSQGHAARSLAKITDEKARAQMMAGNAVRLFHLDAIGAKRGDMVGVA